MDVTLLTEPEADLVIGSNIRSARTLRGLSQEDLGDRLGVTFQQIQKYERGRNKVSAARLLQIARILRVPYTDLLPGGALDSAEPLDADCRALALHFNNISNVEVRNHLARHVAVISKALQKNHHE